MSLYRSLGYNFVWNVLSYDIIKYWLCVCND